MGRETDQKDSLVPADIRIWPWCTAWMAFNWSVCNCMACFPALRFDKAVRGSPFAAGSSPEKIAVDPTGKFVYVTNKASANVSAYTIDPGSGALMAVRGSPFAAGSFLGGVAVDPMGKFVYVASNGDNNVSAYTIDPDSGAIAAVDGSPFPAGSGPYGIAIATVTGP